MKSFYALALLLLLTACGGGGTEDDGTEMIGPPDCVNKPQSCQ